jgi:hypothetical protein
MISKPHATRRSPLWAPPVRRASLLLALWGLAAACGGSASVSPLEDDEGGGGAKAGGAGGASGQGGASAAGAAGSAVSCSPACVLPQICGAQGECITPGTCTTDADCPGGKTCDPTTHACEIGSSCGVTQIKSNIVAPNLLIVQDRSCTMNGMIGAKSKWELAVGALDSVVGSYQGKLQFGLTLFPDNVAPNCTQAKYLLPPSAGNEAKIKSILTAGLDKKDPSHPGSPCVTNGAQTMKQASTEPSLDDKTRKSYFVLVTDGLTQQVCDLTGAPEGTVQIIQDLHDKRGIPTYVIGFGSGQIDKDELNKFAVAGGVTATDPNDPSFKYYRAEDGAALESALQSVAQKSLGCEYKLGSTPPDVGNVHVFFDKSSEVAQDTKHKDGWDYDAASNQVNFYGATCDSLKAGTIGTVDIVLGCPGGTGGSGGASGQGGAGGAGTCGDGSQVCDLANLCPDNPTLGKGFCMMGCCTYGKQLLTFTCIA